MIEWTLHSAKITFLGDKKRIEDELSAVELQARAFG